MHRRDDDPTVGPTPSVDLRTPVPTSFAPGSIIAGRYRLVALLGRGGMAEVFRAEDLTLNQPVALKFLPQDVAADEAKLAQFHHELRVARQVSHKNVCRLYDLAEANGRPLLTMEYVDGEDLAALLRRIGRFPQDRATTIARQLCAGISAAHERGIIHRDLKPANVMIDGEGNVRITDFGIASVAARGNAAMAGTPHYMAPEQLVGEPASTKTDIYALGLILYELFTGKRALDAKTIGELKASHESGILTTPSAIIRDLDPAVEGVILRCLERNPDRRPASALAVAAALPGGDPLAAALAAGETPSPDLLVAAGESAALRVLPGVGLVVSVVMGFLVFAALSARTSIVGRVPLEKPPAVLVDRAQQILGSLGYADRPADHAYGWQMGSDYLSWLKLTNSTPRRWDTLSAGNPPAVVFWYRTSPRAMSPLVPFTIRPTDPPFTVSDMRLVALDTAGRLQEFHAVPPQVDDRTDAPQTPRWKELFDAAGLPMDTFAPAGPQWTPRDYADTRAAWEGPLPQQPDIRVRVEAATYRGRPVSFSIVGPWSRPSRMPAPPRPRIDRIGMAIAIVVVLLLLAGALVLARRHLRSNRADRRGAARLTSYVAIAALVHWVVSNHHLPDIELEFLSLSRTAGEQLLIAAIIWVLYVALESYVRRLWPDSLLGWSRLIAGYFRDPRVGQDVLAGAAFGVARSLIIDLGKARILPALGYAAPQPTYGTNIDALLGTNRLISGFIEVSFHAIVVALLAVLLFVVLRLLLRRTSLGISVTFVVLTLVSANQMTGTSWLVLVFPVASGALMTFVLVRFGLLTYAAMILVSNIVSGVPLTLDLSHWSATPSILSLMLLMALTLFAFFASRAGQPLLGDLLSRD